MTRYALICFGGAGGQHACLVADALGMKSVLLHPISGLLSAYGMGLADIRATRQKTLGVALDDEAPAALARLGSELDAECSAELAAQGMGERSITRHLRAHIRYAGTDTLLSVEASYPRAGDAAALRDVFEDAHRRRLASHVARTVRAVIRSKSAVVQKWQLCARSMTFPSSG